MAIDKAVLLPHETLAWAEEEDGRYRQMKRSEQMQLREEGRRRSGTWNTEADMDNSKIHGQEDLERGQPVDPAPNGGIDSQLEGAHSSEPKYDNEKVVSEEVRRWHIGRDEGEVDGDNTVARRKLPSRMDDVD